MLWRDVLDGWENGKIVSYPKSLRGRFEWNTSCLKDQGNSEFKQRFKTNKILPIKQSKIEFSEYFENKKEKYAVEFFNPSKDTMLVVPIPVRGKNFVTLRDFIDNASKRHQKEFWKRVARVAREMMQQHDCVWISVHGMGVAYTHVRISTSPKYYFDKKLKN